MSDKISELAGVLSKTMKNANNKKTSPYDSIATVTRVDEDGTAWVSIPGGVRETPAGRCITAKTGDQVEVRVSGGRAVIQGNYTAPPTDDTTANRATNLALGAQNAAELAMGEANRAKIAADSAEADAARASDAAAIADGKAVEAGNAAATADSKAVEAGNAALAAQNSLKSVVQGAMTVEKAVSVMQTALEAVVDYDPTTGTTTFTGDGTTTSYTLPSAGSVTAVTINGTSTEDYTYSVINGYTVVTFTTAPADESTISVTHEKLQEYFWHDANGAHVLGDVGGYRNDITSVGMNIVDSSTEESAAEFSVNQIRLGKENGSRSVITPLGYGLYSTGGELGFFIGSDGLNLSYRNIPYAVDEDKSILFGSGAQVDDTRTATYETIPSNATLIVLTVSTSAHGTLEPHYSSIVLEVDNTITISLGGTVEVTYSTSNSTLTMTNKTWRKTYSSTYRISQYFIQEEVPSTYFTFGNRFPGKIYGPYSFAAGEDVVSQGLNTISLGKGTYACGQIPGYVDAADVRCAIGEYNKPSDSGTGMLKHLLQIGNGTSDTNRSNALTVDGSGNLKTSGTIEDGSGNVLANKADGNWTLQGTVTGGTNTLTIPETAKEAYIYTKAGNGEFTKYVYVKGQSIARLEMGGYYISTSDNGLVNLNVSNSNRTYQIRNARYANIDYKSSAVLKVYYR